MARSLTINSIARIRHDGGVEELTFTPGTNVIVGEKNTGKTVWLRMLDYVLGDTGKVEESFDEELIDKYAAIRAEISIGNEHLLLSRHLAGSGVLTKIFINNEAVSSADFSSFILKRLGIPILHYPQGNPYNERTWPELSWKTLSRHIYRREDLWHDLADKQPEFQQHVCLLQFLGIAEHLFPPEYESLINKRNQKFRLEAKKEQFIDTLHEIAREIGTSSEISVAPTYASLDEAIEKLNEVIANLVAEREAVLQHLQSDVEARLDNKDNLAMLAERWATLQQQKDETLTNLKKSKARLEDVSLYKKNVDTEIVRLDRALAAGDVLGDIEVVRCPVCDQSVTPVTADVNTCYLCHRPAVIGLGSEPNDRLDFERNQLREEAKELGTLSTRLDKDVNAQSQKLDLLEVEIAELGKLLQPARKASAAILPPELLIIDRQVGGLQERIISLKRIRKALETRDDISSAIQGLEQEIGELDVQLATFTQNVNFPSANDELQDGMNSYLNALNAEGHIWWTESAVVVNLSERHSRFLINNSSWKIKLGATMKAYFLLAYHYALMSFSGQVGKNYPGFLMLDFPLNFSDQTSVADKENYLIEPFNKLFQRLGGSGQLIVAGRSFEGLDANRIELTEIWT